MRHAKSSIWPVVQRELRAASHRWVTYWERVAVAAGAVFIFSQFNISFSSSDGPMLFIKIHQLFVSVLALGIPLITADCIAREKREGTLGLLFLTSLNAYGIVLGKCAVHMFRAFAIWLAVLPVFAFPFLLGGITWLDVFTAICCQLGVTFVGLAGGLIASAWSTQRNNALILAVIISAMLLTFCCHLQGLLIAIRVLDNYNTVASVIIGAVIMWGHDLPGSWSQLYSSAKIPVSTGVSATLQMLLASLLFLALAIFTAGRHIQNTWCDKIPTRRRIWILKVFCTTLFRNKFQRTMQKSLDWNPIAWLQQYSWKARIGKWGVCLAFLLIEIFFCLPRVSYWNTNSDIQLALLAVLGVIQITVGVSSFLTEKRSGALELILITPLSVNRIIIGRAFGMLKQFLPAGLIIVLFHLVGIWINFDRHAWGGWPHGWDYVVMWDAVFLCGFLTIPVFSTYAALRVKYLLGAALLTCIGVVISGIFGYVATEFCVGSFDSNPRLFIFCTVLSYSSFTALVFFLLKHSLSRRIYSFS